MTCSHSHTLASLRRADLVAKRTLRAVEYAFDVGVRHLESEIIDARGGEKSFGGTAEARKRNLQNELETFDPYHDSIERLHAAQEQAAVCAVDLQIALDERDERRLAARERFTDVLAVAFGASAVSADDGAVDATQDEFGDRVAEELVFSSAEIEARCDQAFLEREQREANDKREELDDFGVSGSVEKGDEIDYVDRDGIPHVVITEADILAEVSRQQSASTVSDEALAAGEGYDAAMGRLPSEPLTEQELAALPF